MPLFNYTAVNAQGEQSEGSLEAADLNAAVLHIKQQGFFPTRINEQVAEAEPTAEGFGQKIKKKNIGKIKSKVLMNFTRQLATLIDAGLPLLRAISTLAKQEKNKNLRLAMLDIVESIESGNTFSESLAQHPKIFNKLYINMVRAGEVGGILEVVLIRLAEFQEKSEKIRGKVASAMVYPIVVLTLAIGILVFLLVAIVPKFQEIFTDLLGGKSLPALTQYVINASEYLQHRWLVILLVLGVLIIAYKVFVSFPVGVRVIDQVKLLLPLTGVLVSKTAISRFSRTLGTLVSSGVPILQALNITKDTSGNVIISEAISKIHDGVKEGESVVSTIEGSSVFPPVVVSMVQVGEETGKLPDMLVKVSDVYEEEVDNTVEGLTSLLEPFMIVFLAVVVGVIVIALFLPLVSIIQNLGQQTGM